MRISRLALFALLPCLALTAASCSDDDTDDSSSDTTEASTDTTAATDDTTGTTAGDTTETTAGDTTETTEGGTASAGGHIEAVLSSGETISGTPEECVIDGQNVTVLADGGNFGLTYDGTTSSLQWQTDSGLIDEQPEVFVTGDEIVTSGVTADGVGYNAEITCA